MPPRLRGRKADTDSPLRTGDDITNPPTRRKRRAATEKAASNAAKSSSRVKEASPEELPREEAAAEEIPFEEPPVETSAPKRAQTKKATTKAASTRSASNGVKKKVAPKEKAAPIRRTTRARARKGSEAPTTEDESNDENDVRESGISDRQGTVESNVAASEVDETTDEKRNDDPTPRGSPDVYEKEREQSQVPEVDSPLPVQRHVHTSSANSPRPISASLNTNLVFDDNVQERGSTPRDRRSPDGPGGSANPPLPVISINSEATDDPLIVADDQLVSVPEELAVSEAALFLDEILLPIGHSWTTTEGSRVFSDNNETLNREAGFVDGGSMTTDEDHHHEEQSSKSVYDQDDPMDLDVESERPQTPELYTGQSFLDDQQVSDAAPEEASTIKPSGDTAQNQPILIDDGPIFGTNRQPIILLDGDDNDCDGGTVDAKQNPSMPQQEHVYEDERIPATPEKKLFTSIEPAGLMEGCISGDENKENEDPVETTCNNLPFFSMQPGIPQELTAIGDESTVHSGEPDPPHSGVFEQESTGRTNRIRDPRSPSGFAVTSIFVDTPTGQTNSHLRLQRPFTFGTPGVTLESHSVNSTSVSHDTAFFPLGESVTDADSDFLQIEHHRTSSGQDKLRLNGREILPSLSAFLDDFVSSYPDARYAQIHMRPYPVQTQHSWHDKGVVIDVDFLHKAANGITAQPTPYFDLVNTDQTGSKRKRPTRQKDTSADESPDKPSNKEADLTQPRRTRSRGAYFNEKGNICIDPPDEDYYEPEDSTAAQREQDENQMMDEEMADEVVAHEVNSQQVAAPSEVTPSKEAEPTSARGSWSARFSFGIGGLFKSPIKFFGGRKPIPEFSSPQAGSDNATSPQESANLDNVARPLFPATTAKTNAKSPRKKTPKAKRQAAIDHNEMLQRREAATEAILQSANRAEEIEAEIQRRVQEELALKQAKKSPAVKKRKRVSDGPGSTPHPKKVGDKRPREETIDVIEPMASNLQTPSRSGYGFYDDVSDEDDAGPPNKRMKTVSFQPSTQSLTTPPQGSDIERIQSRRPPNTAWNYGSMFRDGPSRSALKNTGYIASQGYQSPRYESMWEDVDPETFEHEAPHNIREGIPDSEFNFAGSFRMPETSDSDEGEEEEDDEYDPGQRESMVNTDDAGFTPVRKTTTNMMNVEPETPPAAPQPAHATLPGNKPEVDALQAARTRAHQFTPKQPSRLRETKNVTPPPETADGILQSKAYLKNLDPLVAEELNKIALAADQENVYPVILAELGKVGMANAGNKTKTTLESVKSLNNTVLQEVESSFDGFWSNVGSEIVTNIKSSSESWR